MSESDLPVRILPLIQLLGGETNRYLQANLLGIKPWRISEAQCREFHTHCINAVLTQQPWLQEPYENGDFETSESRTSWLNGHKSRRGCSQVWLKPIDRRQGSVAVSGFGRISYRDFSTGVHAEMDAS